MKPHRWAEESIKIWDGTYEVVCLDCGVAVIFEITESLHPIWNGEFQHPEPEDCELGAIYLVMKS